MTAKAFASTEDTAEKKVSFDQIGPGLYAYTAEGDPNSGVIVGDDGVMVVDAQATPAMANDVIARVAKVTDKPIKYVLLTHYHAVRALGASAYKGAEILASDTTRGLIAERGKQDMDSEIGRFPRLFQSRRVHSRPDLADDHVSRPDVDLARPARSADHAYRARPHRRRRDRGGARRGRGVRRRSRRIQVRLLLRRRAFHRLAARRSIISPNCRPMRWCPAAAVRSPRRHGGGWHCAHQRLHRDALRLGAARASPRGDRSRMPSISRGSPWTRSSRPLRSTSIACRSTSRAPMTRRAASNGR